MKRTSLPLLRRRDFITLLGSATAWPHVARGQQATKRIGVIMSTPDTDDQMRSRIQAFRQELQALGWIEGRNLQTEIRWGGGEANRAKVLAAQLLGLAPDVIVVGNPVPLAAVLQQSRSIPVVFASVSDPVEGGFVQSFSHPGANVTGFTNFETKTAEKWLELLREIAPKTTRAGLLRRAKTPGLLAMQRQIEQMAQSLSVRITTVEVSDAAQIEHALESFAVEPNGGLIVLPGPIQADQEVIIAQTAQHRIPAIYPYRFYVDGGGLLSYGPDTVDIYRRTAGYVDRILKGEKPADLPVQNPTKYETVLNLKTARALALPVPPTLLVAADEIIE